MMIPLSFAACLFVGCGRQDAPESVRNESTGKTSIVLEDQAASLGISFKHSGDGAADHFFPSIMAGGAAMQDLDQDGDLDVLLLNSRRSQTQHEQVDRSGQSSILYLQSGDGIFTDATAGSGFENMGFATGCAAGDVNNDGMIDLYVTAYGRDQFFLNKGNGKFDEIAETVGVINDRWGTSAAFLDYDRDGWLDLFVANYVEYDPGRDCVDSGGRKDFCNPAMFPRTSDRLYRNITGNEPGNEPGNTEVRFEDATLEAGIASALGAGLGVIAADFNGDDWIDIYVANDGHGNSLWINQQNGAFEDHAVLKGVAYDPAGQGQGSMGVATGDLNADGLPDLVVANLDGESNAVYNSFGTGFLEDSLATGIADASFGMTGFGIALLDIDNDGDLDLSVANGRVRRKIPREKPGDSGSESLPKEVGGENPFWRAYAELGSLLQQNSGVFVADSSPTNQFVSTPAVGRGLCFGDVNNDGRLDLLVTFLDRPAAMYVNKTNPGGHWLSVRLIEPRLGGRDAIGARVTLLSGNRGQDRWLSGGGSYQCASDFRLHFGMGDEKRFDSIEVVWPNGDKEVFPGGETDQFLVLKHESGSAK